MSQRNPEYDNCFVCGVNNETGMQVSFYMNGDKAEAVFHCIDRFQGYPNTIHGGITATLLDEAMANVLIHQEITAVTAEMTVKYKHPVLIGDTVTVSGWVDTKKSRIITCKSCLVNQDKVVVAEASGVYFVKK